ncbi:MAG: Coenzyme F420 hydrogenase/dehydrogenase, beta subunit C-terminal domain [Bacillota bacterium]|nr:Coenzyme F420 hydrogenase/dehydrogenase, beta subunit C-terminal domain [Bacillota bacterium]
MGGELKTANGGMTGVRPGVGSELAERAAGLLAGGEVRMFLGYGAGRTPLRVRPRHVLRPEAAGGLVWNEFCAPSLAKYLLEEQEEEGRVGVLVKACDLRAVKRLVADRRVERERVLLVGVGCPGVVDAGKVEAVLARAVPGEMVEEAGVRDGVLVVGTRSGVREFPREEYLLERCLHCEDPNPRDVDLFVGPEVAPWPARPHDYAEVAEVAALGAAERAEYWDRQFARCLRCFACRSVCPACSCRECCFDVWEPMWLPREVSVPEQYMFHFTRAFHVAGRCVDCGECERVCPVGVPLMQLNRALQKEIAELFGVERPWEPQEKEPLAMYTPDDPDFH